MKSQTLNRKAFEKAKQAILKAAINPVTKDGNTYVSAEVVTKFTGRVSPSPLYGRAGLNKAHSLKDNETKGDNGIGLFMISRKIPVSQVKNFVKTKGTHNLLGKNVNSPKVKQEIESVLAFIEAAGNI